MSITMAVDDAAGKLKALVHGLFPGSEIILTENEQPVARLVAVPPRKTSTRPGPGLCRSMISYIAPDFDAPLEELKEYM